MRMWIRIAVSTAVAVVPLFALPQSFRQFDFKNASYAWEEPTHGVPSKWQWLTEVPKGSVRLTNGLHRFSDSSVEPGETVPYLRLISITHSDLLGDGREEAIVDLLYSTGGTANWNYLYVYSSDGQHPKLIAVLESGSRADGGLIRVRIQRRLLILDFADTALRVEDCCSEGFVRVRYRWRHHAFIESRVRERGTLRLTGSSLHTVSGRH
jgi:hypothetical protein